MSRMTPERLADIRRYLAVPVPRDSTVGERSALVFARDLLDALDAARAELARVTEERTTAFRLRSVAVHAAVWRAMNDTHENALAALRDHGYVHEAVHELLDFPASASLPDEAAAHIARQDERIDRLEADVVRYRTALDEMRAALEEELSSRGRRGLGETLPRELGSVPVSALKYLLRLVAGAERQAGRAEPKPLTPETFAVALAEGRELGKQIRRELAEMRQVTPEMATARAKSAGRAEPAKCPACIVITRPDCNRCGGTGREGSGGDGG